MRLCRIIVNVGILQFRKANNCLKVCRADHIGSVAACGAHPLTTTAMVQQIIASVKYLQATQTPKNKRACRTPPGCRPRVPTGFCASARVSPVHQRQLALDHARGLRRLCECVACAVRFTENIVPEIYCYFC